MKTVSAAQMVRMMKPSCADCASFQREDGDWGLCKARPPLAQMMIDDNGEPYQVTYWPQVDEAESVCGEFKAGQ